MVHYGKKPEKNITKTFRKEEEERLEIIRVTLKNFETWYFCKITLTLELKDFQVTHDVQMFCAL